MGRGATAASRGSAGVAGEHPNTVQEVLTDVKPGPAAGTSERLRVAQHEPPLQRGAGPSPSLPTCASLGRTGEK